jgi:D-alanine-D-alanine ligase
MSEFGKVAVLLGGPSAEREISLLSGNAVLAALKGAGINAHAYDPAERSLYQLKHDGFERVFIALHGRFGEDGTVQGALEVLGMPYTGSGVMASALAMDKWRTKLVWLASNIPTPRYRVVDADTDWWSVVAELGLPLVVKPAREGSTIGITRVTSVDRNELATAYVAAVKHDDLVIVEEFVAGIGTDDVDSASGPTAHPHRGAGRKLRLPQQILFDDTKFLSVRDRCLVGAGNPVAVAGGVSHRRLFRIGAST